MQTRSSDVDPESCRVVSPASDSPHPSCELIIKYNSAPDMAMIYGGYLYNYDVYDFYDPKLLPEPEPRHDVEGGRKRRRKDEDSYLVNIIELDTSDSDAGQDGRLPRRDLIGAHVHMVALGSHPIVVKFFKKVLGLTGLPEAVVLAVATEQVRQATIIRQVWY